MEKLLEQMKLGPVPGQHVRLELASMGVFGMIHSSDQDGQVVRAAFGIPVGWAAVYDEKTDTYQLRNAK